MLVVQLGACQESPAVGGGGGTANQAVLSIFQDPSPEDLIGTGRQAGRQRE